MSKEHKKLYKAGKNWLTATITVVAMMLAGGMATQNVKADTTTASADTQLVQAQQPAADEDDSTASQTADTQSTQQDKTTTTNQAAASQETSTSDLTVSQAKANAGNQWTHFNQGWSYTDGQGNWVYNQWQRINNNWYYFNNGGYAQTGWFKSGAGNWYHFDDQNAWANTGWQRINNRWYYFDNQNAWALTGWQKINNRWYFFDPTNAWADTGWFKSGAGNWYYFDPTNAWADTGWFYQDFNWYYFDPTNAWALTGWQKINNRWYYFDPVNAWASRGWHEINNKWYYFDIDNSWMLTGIVNIDGSNICIFKDNGEWTGDYYSSVAEAKQALAQQKINAAQDKVDEAQNQVNEAQYQVDDDQDALNEAKDNLDAIENGNHLTVPQEWINAWKSIISKGTDNISKSNSRISNEYQVLLNDHNIRQGLLDSWKDNPLDEKVSVTINTDSTLSDQDAKVATQYAIYLLNELRAQLGTPLVKATTGSVAVAQNVAKDYVRDNWGSGHDEQALSDGAHALETLWTAESIDGCSPIHNLNDLKHQVYDSVVNCILEGDYPQTGFGHATHLLGISEAVANLYFADQGLIGVSYTNIKGPEIHFVSIPYPYSKSVQQKIREGYYIEGCDSNDKINQAPYNEEVTAPDYKVDPAKVLPYQQAVTAAENKLKKSQNVLNAAQENLKRVQAANPL